MERRMFLKSAALSAVTFPLLGSGRLYAKSSKRPNILYVFADQWRASAFGYAGDPNVKTPNIDKLAAESLDFKNAVSCCPVCTPYRASLFTGKYPTTTGMFMNDLCLPDEELCMGEIFKSAGYDTGYVGKWHLDGRGRHSFIDPERRQGFDYFKVAECDHNYPNSHYYTGNSLEKRYWDGYDSFAQTKDVQQWLTSRKAGDKPFMFVLSYGTPHFPHHTAPKEYKAMYPPEKIKLAPNVPDEMKEKAKKESQGYYGHCSAIDKCIGDLMGTLKATGLYENTIVVFTSDHGEMMGSHGQRPSEKQRPWDESACVPFLIRYPAKLKPRQVKTPINTPDILPTLLGMVNVKKPNTFEGKDLSKVIYEKEKEHDRDMLIMSVVPFAGFHFSHGGREFRGIRNWRYTYVRDLNGPWLLFDNEKDQWQMNNLVKDPSSKKLLAKMEKALDKKLKQINDPFKPHDYYLDKWGYEVGDKGGWIPYKGNHKIQGPSM